MDASLEEALVAHRDYMHASEGDRFGNGVGVGNTPYITLGHARRSDCGDFCACSKLELGTWAERLCEMCEEVEESQTFENVREKVQGIARWWDMSGEYMKNHSSPLGKTAYEPLYRLIMERDLLKAGGLLVADNVLYRGLPAEIAEGEVDLRVKYRAKEGSEMISEKTVLNAEALVKFNSLVKSNVDEGSVRSLMLPVRDGMMAVVKLTQSVPPPPVS